MQKGYFSYLHSKITVTDALSHYVYPVLERSRYQTFQLQLWLQLLVIFGQAFFTAKVFLLWISSIFLSSSSLEP